MAEENTDTWRSITLGDSGSLAPLFDAAGNAAEVNKATLTVAKAQYESAKLLALASLNPALAALGAIIDEIDKNLQDLENLGFFSLFVNPTTVDPKTTKPLTYGRFFNAGQVEVKGYWDVNNELVGAINGKTVKDHPPRETNSDDETLYEVGVDIPQATDSRGTPLTVLVPEYETSKASSGGTKNNMTGLIEMTPNDVIATMVEAFSDEGDLKPQYLDANNNFVDSEALAAESPSTKEKLITYVDNKPTFSQNADMGGIVLIWGATDVSGFRDLVFNLKQFFNITEFDELFNSLRKLIKPPQVKVRVQDVHQLSIRTNDTGKEIIRSASSFQSKLDNLKDGESIVLVEVDSELGRNKTGFEAEVVKKNTNRETPEIKKTIPPATKHININTLPYYEEELTLQPLNLMESKPKPGFLLVEAIEKQDNEPIQTSDTSENLKSQKIGQKLKTNPKYSNDSEDIPNSEKEWIPKKGSSSPTIVCRVKVNEDKPDSKKPNFTSYKLVDLIPILGTTLRDIRGEVNSYRGLISIANEGVQDTIDAIDKRVEKIEKVASNVIAVQETIANLKDIGLYSLTLDPKIGGTTGFLERLQAATDAPPNTLKYSAGALFVAGSPTEKSGAGLQQAFDTLKAILKL